MWHRCVCELDVHPWGAVHVRPVVLVDGPETLNLSASVTGSGDEDIRLRYDPPGLPAYAVQHPMAFSDAMCLLLSRLLAVPQSVLLLLAV